MNTDLTPVTDKEHLAHKVEGFGSSDAWMIMSFAKKMEMSNSLLRRIAEIKGEVERQEVSFFYADLGNRVEEDYYLHLLSIDETAVNNPHYSLKPNPYKNFTVYTHIDFRTKDGFIELKATKDGFGDSYKKYFPQLCMHYYILKEEGLPISLSIYDTSDVYKTPQDYFFQEHKITDVIIDSIELEEGMELLKKGFSLLDDIWEDIEPFKEKEVINLTTEEVENSEVFKKLNDYLLLERDVKAFLDEQRALLLKNMTDSGIKTISWDNFTISVKDEHTRATFDKSALAKDYPDIDLSNYNKISKVKATVSIKSN